MTIPDGQCCHLESIKLELYASSDLERGGFLTVSERRVDELSSARDLVMQRSSSIGYELTAVASPTGCVVTRSEFHVG